MKHLFALYFLLIISTAVMAGGKKEVVQYDEEQQQLEWCFEYSNLLGYDIQSVENPELYKSIADWIGTPYHYSGNDKCGVDCSGFVTAIYKATYQINLDGSAKDIYKRSDAIRKNELHEGDLVFFKIKGHRISHVGIFLGDNKFVHSSTQKGVVISNLDDPYYEKYFYKGGRISS